MANSFSKLVSELNTLFPERRDVITGSIGAVLAGEHVLMLGPPGTAKSALVRAIASAFGGTYFERLMTKFSTPEELFGPVSLKALEQDRFSRVTTGKLPEAQFAFIDEVFKSNSAILNSLLTAMNERLFHNDGAPVQMPLISLFGASNELPEGKELEALYDRFMIRFDISYILRPNNLRSMLMAAEPVSTVRLTVADLKAAQDEVQKVKVTDETVEALITVREALQAEGLTVSDRRLKKSLKVVKASAYMAGENETVPEDLLCLVDAFWREPKERSKVSRVVGKLADPISIQITEVLDAAREQAQKLEQKKATDRKAFIAEASTAVQTFDEQQAKLNELARSAGKRASVLVTDASAEINTMRNDYARAVSGALGLGLGRR